MPEIVDRGRGPEIDGTRITVYDIMDYLGLGWHHTTIAATLQLSSDEVLAAIRYIDEHKDEVQTHYQEILDRCARGNPPEIQAKLNAIEAKYKDLWADRFRRAEQQHNDGNHRRQ